MHRNFIIIDNIIMTIINIAVVFQLHIMHCVMKLQPSNDMMFQRLTVSPYSRKIGETHQNKAITRLKWGTRWRNSLRHCATSREVAGSIPVGVTGIFREHNPSGRTMALGSTQPLAEMSTRNTSWGLKAAGA